MKVSSKEHEISGATKVRILQLIKARKTQRQIHIDTEVSERTIYRYKRKYGLYTEEKIDQMIEKLESQQDMQGRNYEKQQNCDHKKIKIMARCTCTLCLSENNPKELIEILEKINPPKNIIEQTL